LGQEWVQWFEQPPGWRELEKQQLWQQAVDMISFKKV